MSENHKKFQSKAIGTGSKQVYYLCMEFLMGRSLKVSLFNLGLEDVAQKAVSYTHLLSMTELSFRERWCRRPGLPSGSGFASKGRRQGPAQEPRLPLRPPRKADI